MRTISVLFGLIAFAAADCYLMSADAECAVCWKTTYADANDTVGVTRQTICADAEVTQKWTEVLPKKMIELTDYPVKWEVRVPGLTVVPKKELDVSHANIHSCLAEIGGCTPFVKNSPGLSTHTPAVTVKELTKDANGVYGTEFSSNVNLKNAKYTIIAHTRLFIDEGAGKKASKLDIAIGISRTVDLPDVSSSESSIVSAAVAGSVVLLIVLACGCAGKQGVINPEKFLSTFLNSPIIVISNMVLGLGDVIAFLFTLLNMMENPTQETANLIPIAIMILSVSWIISTAKFVMDGLKIYDMYVLGGKKANEKIGLIAAQFVAKEMEKRGGSSSSSESKELKRQMSIKIQQQVSADDDLMEKGKELARVSRKITLLYYILVTCFLEQAPLIGVSVYLLTVSPEVIVADCLTLLFSAVVLGANVMRVVEFPKLIAKKRDIGQHFHASVGGEGGSKVTPAGTDSAAPLNP